MSFDHLPGRINHPVDLGYHFYVPPPRPVIPWASFIVPAVDKIAQGIMYQSPYERQKRGLEMAQINAQTQLMPQQLDVQRQQLGVEKQKLDWEKQFYTNFGQNQANLPAGWIMGANGPVYDPTKYKSSLDIARLQGEANSYNGYAAQADAARQQAGHQPVSTDTHDDDPALVDWYKAQAAGQKPWDIQYGAQGNITEGGNSDE